MTGLQSFENGHPAPPGCSGAQEPSLLARFLADRDVSCPRCGYNLRTLQGERCTECGTKIELGVHAAEPILAPWIAANVPASLGGGMGLLFLVLILAGAGMPPTHWWWMVFGCWACILIEIMLLWRRRVFLRRNAALQWSTAIVLWLILAALVIGLARVR